ncbi:MAG: presenilin family intramembrane aspartyl protease PSH, partial [Halobacteriales archaeon]
PGDPTNSLLYVGVILVATGAMLLAFRLGGERLIRAFVLVTAALLSWYVFLILLPPVAVPAGVPLAPTVAALGLAVGLWRYPEWWVIDAAGVVMGAGAAGVFGTSFGLLPAVVLLVVLAVYDAISVYGTEHMLTLAEGVMTLKVPVLFVVPTSLSYSYLAAMAAAEDAAEADSSGDSVEEDSSGEHSSVEGELPGENFPSSPDGTESAAGAAEDRAVDGGPLQQGAVFVGLGDAVVPTVLTASAVVYLDAPRIGVLSLHVPALGAIAGTVAGVLALLWLVFRGRPHAGLPLLNGGAIAGYLIGAAATGIPLATALGV